MDPCSLAQKDVSVWPGVMLQRTAVGSYELHLSSRDVVLCAKSEVALQGTRIL